MTTRIESWTRSLFLSILTLGYVFAGCAFGDLVFSIPREQVKQQMYAGQYAFLRDVDYKKHDLSEAERIGKGGRYYLSEIYRLLGSDAIADRFLKSSWEHERMPWRYEAGLKLLARLSEKKQYYRMLPIAAEGVRIFNNERRYLSYYLEALYWQRQYGRVLALLPTFRAQFDFEQQYSVGRIRHNYAEAQLWEAVSRYRGWRGKYLPEFRELFFDYSASAYHTRAYLYIIDESKLRDVFNPWELALFRAKHLTATESYREAVNSYESVFETLPVEQYEFVLAPRTIHDIGRAYEEAERALIGQKRLQSVAEVLPSSPAKAVALEWQGRLLAYAKRYEEAQTTLHVAYDMYPSDRILWRIFDVAFSASFADGLASMERHGKNIRNPRYYSDLFDRQTSLAVRERRWGDFWRLRRIAIQYGAPYDRARVAVVAAEAVRTNITVAPDGVTKSDLRAELERAGQQDQSLYYRYLASFLLGQQEHIAEIHAALFPTRYQHPVLSRDSCKKLIDGYLQFSLIEQGYRQLTRCVDYYKTADLVDIARNLYERRVFNYAMRVVDLARRRSEFFLDREVGQILYPRAYSEYIDEIAEQNEIGRYFFYATIREESYFNHTVSSHAGAIGLGQFIPSTAHTVAKRINIPLTDLTDPETNLTLSGFHLRELIDAFDNKQLFALAGYNAGFSRARQWLRNNSDYSDLLKHEGISFRETRHYIRKIAVTNIHYAYLYQGRRYTDVIKDYFTDLGQF